MIYLDNHATTSCDPRVIEAMLPWFTTRFGNAGSVEHALGREAAEAVEEARGHIARLVGAAASEIVFTSGATESNNLAIKGAARSALSLGDHRRRIVTLATEHHAVLDCVTDLAGEGFEPVILPVGRDGLLEPAVLAEALRAPTLLVSIMAVNNEIGVIQDLPALGALVKEAGAALHVDAAQAAGRMPLDVTAMRADLVSLSGHKMYGPKGIGALYVRRRPRMRVAPLFSGGGQERGLRPGTLPVPMIVAMGEAARLAAAEGDQDSERLRRLADRLLARLRAAVPGLVLNGHPQRRVSGNLNLTFPARAAKQILEAAPDLCLSTSSACTTAADGGLGPSHVLTAIGLSVAEAQRSLRIGLGRFTSDQDVEAAAKRLATASRPQVAAAWSGGVTRIRIKGEPMAKMTFVERDGTHREVDAPLGLSVLEVAHKHGVDLEGACEGSLACSTCHVIVNADWFDKLTPPTEDEEDMLDLAFGLEETSRLGCQIVIDEALDGLVVRLPAGTRNAQG